MSERTNSTKNWLVMALAALVIVPLGALRWLVRLVKGERG